MAAKPERLRGRNENHTLWLLDRVWDRVNEQNEHFMGCVVGREGSGKSYSALKLADIVDPSFTADRAIFDITELLDVLGSGDHEPGNFYVLDEAGVQLGNRTWQDRGQILANQALQLIRDHNLGLIFTLPRLSELDTQAEGRLQAVLEMQDKEDGEWASFNWKWLDPDRLDESGTIYKKYPRRRQNGRLMRITENRVAPPRESLVEDYEERKSSFQQAFYEETVEELKGETEGDDGDGDGSLTAQELAQRVSDEGLETYVSRHGQTGRPYIDKELLRAKHEASHSTAEGAKSLLEQQFNTDELEQLA